MCIRDSDDLNNEFTSDNNYIIKNMMLENNSVNIDSDNEILEGVEYDKGMLVCGDESESCLLYTSRCV